MSSGLVTGIMTATKFVRFGGRAISASRQLIKSKPVQSMVLQLKKNFLGNPNVTSFQKFAQGPTWRKLHQSMTMLPWGQSNLPKGMKNNIPLEIWSGRVDGRTGNAHLVWKAAVKSKHTSWF